MRTTISPTFNTTRLRLMFSHIESTAHKLTSFLRGKQESGEPVELREVMGHFTMDVIASTGFGIQVRPGGRFGPKVGQIDQKWDKSGGFFRSTFSTFWLSLSNIPLKKMCEFDFTFLKIYFMQKALISCKLSRSPCNILHMYKISKINAQKRCKVYCSYIK